MKYKLISITLPSMGDAGVIHALVVGARALDAEDTDSTKK